MSTSPGWQQEGMLQKAVVETQASVNTSGPSLPAFTPINPCCTPVLFVSPQMTLNQMGLDDDTYYNTFLEPTPEVPVQMSKRKGAQPQANKGRAVSIGRVWEYRDEGDVAAQNHGANFEASFPKRRKSVPTKRENYALGQLKSGQHMQEQGHLNPAPLHGSEHHEEEQGFQLTIPPDSSKRLPKKTAPKPQNSKFRPSPFRNPVITKPSVYSETDFGEDANLMKPVTIQKGWTSTQEVVKHQFNGLSKTTLDKLSAFRYKLSSEVPADPFLTRASLEVEKFLGPVEKAGGPPSSSEYGSLPSNDSVFVDVCRVGQDPTGPAPPTGFPIKHPQRVAWDADHILHGDDVSFSDANWKGSIGSTVGANVCSSQDRLLATIDMDLPHIPLQKTPGSLDIGAAPALLPLSSEASFDVLKEPQHICDYGASEKRALAGIMTDVNHSSQRNENGVLEYVSQPDCFFADESEPTLEHGLKQEQNPGGPEPCLEGLRAGWDEYQGDCSSQIPQHGLSASESQHPVMPPPRYLSDVQGKRSEIDKPHLTPRDNLNDYELDDFNDEGLNDADLLAIASDAAISETQTLVNGMRNGNPDIECLPDTFPLVRSHASLPTVSVGADAHLVQDSRPTSLEIMSDDDYPLEDGLEEEDMLSLPVHVHGVIETFQVPPSVEYSFGNEPMSGEVYDKSLQFSPPKPRTSSALPGKAADVSLTDEYSPSKAQVVEGLGSDHAEEGDWSLIRSNDGVNNIEVPIVSDPTSDVENTAPDKITKRVIPLGPQKQCKRQRYADIHAATRPSGSQEIVLDDSHEYKPLKPFARPDFPSLVLDRCPIPGVTAQPFLRVCFRVGEMFKEGARCNALKQDAVIELFARVTFSSREPGSTQQHFQFADLWHDRPPFPTGILGHYKTSGLVESESRAFIGAEEHMLARCIGRLRRGPKNTAGWLIDIVNIRPTDWEEIKWTKRIVSAGLVKSEKGGI